MSTFILRDVEAPDQCSYVCDECFARERVKPLYQACDWPQPPGWSRRYVRADRRGFSLSRDLCPRCTPLHLALRGGRA